MACTIEEFIETPNPDALKCIVTGGEIPPLAAPEATRAPGEKQAIKPRGYSSPQAAAKDPIALALLSIPGVRNVLIHPAWLSIGKDPHADWKTLKPRIKQVLREHT